jgi:hypothetical protein
VNEFVLQIYFRKKTCPKRWGASQVRGCKGYVVKEKMKLLKGTLKTWNKGVYGDIDVKFEDLTLAIDELEIKSESVGLSEVELSSRKKMFEELWVLLKVKITWNSKGQGRNGSRRGMQTLRIFLLVS